jgi:hypothetical protein
MTGEAMLLGNLGRLAGRALQRARRIDLQDPLVNWLKLANAGMLDPGNVHCMDLAVSRMPADTAIVEIGSFCGLSTNILFRLKQKHSRSNPIFSCDRWEFEGAASGALLPGSATVTHVEYRQLVRDSFIRNVTLFSRPERPATIEVFSDEFFSLWAEHATVEDVFGRQAQLGGEIGFAYIDGNHTYDFARRDFDNVDRFLAPGGYILFDDSSKYSGFPGVYRVVREGLAMDSYELVASNPNYLLRKRLQTLPN